MKSTKDNNFKSYVNESNLLIENFEAPEVTSIYSDILKFSNCNTVLVKNSTIPGGKEDAIDAVRGSNYAFQELTITGNVTIKGSIDTWSFKDCIIKGRIEIGNFDNYWTLGRQPTRNGTIENVVSATGKPITVLLFDSTNIHIINSNVKIIKIPKFIWLPYFLLRRTYLRITGVISNG